MAKLISFALLCVVKVISHVFYRGQFLWLTKKPEDPWKEAKLIVFLNHTSLFEPIFIQHLSFSYIWQLVRRVNVPGADITLNRPIVGRFWKLMLPNISSVTRKKDHSWTKYLHSIRSDSIIVIAPEGRMKRPNGLDKYGKPMTVKGGVADILELLDEGGLILCLSGGLHHVQAPGQMIPRIFKTIRMNLVYLDIKNYKAQFADLNPRERKLKITQDMQQYLEMKCPKDQRTWNKSNSAPHAEEHAPETTTGARSE